MNNIAKSIIVSALTLASFALTSCQDELYNKPKQAPGELTRQSVYIKGGSTIQSFFVEKEDVVVNDIKVALTHLPTEEVKVGVEAGNTTQLETYNKAHGTTYVMLPAEMYSIDKEIAFESGESIKSLGLKIKDLVFNPAYTYALPIKLTNSNKCIIDAESEVLLVLEQRISTKALRIVGSGSEDESMFPNDFKVDAWTLEVMVNRASYLYNNRSICGTKLVTGSSMNDEIYIRFGDVTIKPNQLQIKTGNSQIDIPEEALAAQPNTWYMLGFKYDGKANSVYVNGVKVIEREIRTGAYGLTGFWIGGSNELIREVRFWKSARTDKEILDNTWKLVDANDDNLLLYYPLNGKKRNVETGEITEDESMLWDWSKSQKHLSMPSGAKFVNNGSEPFIFPIP